MMNNDTDEGDAGEIRIPASYSDILAGIRHDARVARAEGFDLVAARAEALERELEAHRASLPAGAKFFLVLVPDPPAPRACYSCGATHPNDHTIGCTA